MCTLTACEQGWAEPLGPDCPPSGSTAAGGETHYRLVENDPPTATDFMSHRARGLPTGDACECRARSVSLVVTMEKALENLKLPRWRRMAGVAAVTMPSGAGALKKSKHHVDWWRCAGFDVVGQATVTPRPKP